MRATTFVTSSLIAILFSSCQADPNSGRAEPATDQPAEASPAIAPTPTPNPANAPSLASAALSQSCTPTPPIGEQCVLFIDGEITPGLAHQAKEVADRATASGGKYTGLRISSNGGDLEEALKIGQLARTLEWMVVVPKDGVCYSSCVLVLAGGVSRHPLGTIGIHRPYFASGAASTNDARDAYASIRKEVTDFLQDGGIRTTLWDDMLNTPPEQIRELSFPELETYGLWGKDPSFVEKKARQQMQWYGIDRAELNRRTVEGKRLCGEAFPNDSINRVVCADRYLRTGSL